jgi:hypothetical protein
LQEKNLKEINAAGGLDLIINEDNMHEVSDILTSWANPKQH